MTVTLRDGSRVAIRPLEPDDREALRAAFDRLSPESRYRRFFGPMPQLRERDLDYLTRIDHHDHEAVVAIEPGSGELVGVARFVRTGDTVAEPAVVVADDWQGRGVGGRLLDTLADRAREEQVRTFEAPVLATNEDAIRALARLGTTTRRPAGREVELRIELPPAGHPAEGWRTVLRAFAAGAVEPALALWDFVWPRRRPPADRPHRNVVVVGTDGSAHAASAVDVAADLAGRFGAALELVGAHRFAAADQEDVAAAVAEAARRLRARSLHVHEHLRRGDPALVLADVAAERNARLIVVGAGEHSAAARRLVGSTADVIAERAPCNVLIVRPS